MTLTLEPWMLVVAAQLLIGIGFAVWLGIDSDSGLDGEGLALLGIAEAIWIAPVLALAWLGT